MAEYRALITEMRSKAFRCRTQAYKFARKRRHIMNSDIDFTEKRKLTGELREQDELVVSETVKEIKQLRDEFKRLISADIDQLSRILGYDRKKTEELRKMYKTAIKMYAYDLCKFVSRVDNRAEWFDNNKNEEWTLLLSPAIRDLYKANDFLNRK